ncbi:MAG: hypothetical protein ACYCXP_03265 [Leptospirillum sp.]
MKWLVMAGRSQQWIFSAMKLSVGVLFSLTGIFFGQTFAASMDDERFGLTGKASKVLGGVVTQIRGGLNGQTSFLMDLVPVSKQGRPFCQKLSGHLVTIFKNRFMQSRREHSAFVVMEDPVAHPSPHLSVGDCLTVKARKVIPIWGNTTHNTDHRIRILSIGKHAKKEFFQAFFIRLWRKHPAWPSAGVFSQR